MTDPHPRDDILRNIVPADLGAVEGLTFFRNVTRTLMSEPGLVRVRDKDADGRVLADIGYPPSNALRAGLLLVRAAINADPSLRDSLGEVIAP